MKEEMCLTLLKLEETDKWCVRVFERERKRECGREGGTGRERGRERKEERGIKIENLTMHKI